MASDKDWAKLNVSIDADLAEGVKEYAEKREIPLGEAVEALLTTAFSRLASLAKYAKGKGKPAAKKAVVKKAAKPVAKKPAAKKTAAKTPAKKSPAKKAAAPAKKGAPATKKPAKKTPKQLPIEPILPETEDTVAEPLAAVGM